MERMLKRPSTNTTIYNSAARDCDRQLLTANCQQAKNHFLLSCPFLHKPHVATGRKERVFHIHDRTDRKSPSTIQGQWQPNSHGSEEICDCLEASEDKGGANRVE